MIQGNVINVRNRKGNPNEVYIGRPSVFGNPFSHLKYSRAHTMVSSREQAIALHESYMLSKADTNPEFRAQVRSLYGKTLVCFCAPLDCHGWNLLALATKLANEEK